MNKINEILKEVLKNVNPDEDDLEKINEFLKKFIGKLEKKLKSMKINAEVFVGGSFAKKTMIKKGDYDVDVFVRFEKKENNEKISDITEKALKNIIKFTRIHGSRDYFKLECGEGFFIELIPVVKIKSTKEAENITDLSYFHVNYIRRKIKTEKMIEEIRLAKAFCHANKCYGAESYINGFSGYALELLICYYRNFLKFAKAMAKIKEKEVIDIEKHYKNKNEVVMNMNSAKLISPVILIDPTYKQRNALAALSEETFENFRKACKSFLKNPNAKAFEAKKMNIERIKENAKKKKLEFVHIELKTDKQEGDVAGSKLIKFYKHIKEEISRAFIIKDTDFEYNNEKTAECFFVVKSKKEIIFTGPEIKDKESVKMFRKKHKRTFVKNKKIYAKEKISQNIKEYIFDWESKHNQRMLEMHILELKFI